jgi:gluconolactonase
MTSKHDQEFVEPAETAENETPSGLGRRQFLSASAGLAAATAMAPAAFGQTQNRQFGPGAPPIHYVDADIIVVDDRFKKYRIGNTTIQRLHSGTSLWAEGPAWNGPTRSLVWSDIPNNRQLRYCAEDDHVSENFRIPSNNSNGNTFDFQGRQISCEHLTRRVVRYEFDGSATVLADSYNGKTLNAPNDVVVRQEDDSIWFTDPGYGALGLYEGTDATAATGSKQPYQKEAVYVIDAKTGKLSQVADQPLKPNGICFSPDYKTLYVLDTGITHYPNAKNIIWAYDVDGMTLKNARTFADMEWKGKSGFADGADVDADGNVWAGVGWVGQGWDGIHVFEPKEGALIGVILLPEICANCVFGGEKHNRLFMASSQSMYAVYVNTHGAHASGT